MSELSTESSKAWFWCVADDSNQERRYSPLDVNYFPPEFGPFETRQDAEDFAALRPAYRVAPPI